MQAYFLSNVFVLVDAHSKWIDVHFVHSITAAKTVEKLRIIFATHGIPHKVVTDNGLSFTSEDFNTFMSHRTAHVTTAPYYPQAMVWLNVMF